MSRRGCLLAMLVAVAAAAPAQAVPGAQDPGQQPGPPVPYVFDYGHLSDKFEGDHLETYVYGGFRFRWPSLGIAIHGQNALLLADRQSVTAMMQQGDGGGGPPRRGIEPPAPRRRLSPDAMHERVNSLLRALGQAPRPLDARLRATYRLPQFLYFEGDVVVFQGDAEVARCRRLWISPLDDRMVVEGAELRYRSKDPRGGEQTFVLRGEQLVKQGPRWTGRNLLMTTCDAGRPHVAVASGELELIESGDQFEVWSRGNVLQLGGTSLLPLPNAHFFTGEQSEIPIKGASAGYSSTEGIRGGLQVGLPWNRTGGAIHEWLTGRPAREFRGDLDLGVGWIEKRGFPLDGGLDYRAEGLYEGRTEGFWLDDDGPNRREILDNIDGSTITDRNRTLARTQNRVRLGPTTNLDLTAFHAGDAAVYSEFFRGDYHDRELPESSVNLSHAADNVLVTVGARVNLDAFSYRDDRGLAPFFVEELPVATLNWLAQQIATTPWDTPVVLDASTEVGQRRRNFDDLVAGPTPSDTTLRVDQLVELSAPFSLGPVNLRPFADARITAYDETAAGGSDERLAFAAGMRLGSRFSRTWNWLDDAGAAQGVRHVIAPLLTFANRYHVDGDPGDYRQFDATDALTERNLVRFEVRNLLQRMDGGEPAAGGRPPAPRDFLLVDLAQDFWPQASRDNAGEELGLLYYDFLVRPSTYWTPFDHLAFAVYGDHDWQNGLRTFDTEMRFGKVLGLDWMADFRRDAVVEGAVGLGASAALLGRWDAQVSGQYDLDRSDFLHYDLGLLRRDHDWTIRAAISYDPFEDALSFRLEFQPRFGGLARDHGRDWNGSGHFADEIGATSY